MEIVRFFLYKKSVHFLKNNYIKKNEYILTSSFFFSFFFREILTSSNYTFFPSFLEISSNYSLTMLVLSIHNDH
jgi:hypothetical protein